MAAEEGFVELQMVLQMVALFIVIASLIGLAAAFAASPNRGVRTDDYASLSGTSSLQNKWRHMENVAACHLDRHGQKNGSWGVSKTKHNSAVSDCSLHKQEQPRLSNLWALGEVLTKSADFCFVCIIKPFTFIHWTNCLPRTSRKAESWYKSLRLVS